MVVDLVQKLFQKISICLGFVLWAAAFHCISVIAQTPSAQQPGSQELSSVTIFLKDRPAPKITPAQTMKRVKAKAPIRNFSIYGIDDGLALQSVLSGYKDHDGNLWFATGGGGVSKFNGSTFTNFDERHGMGNGVVRTIGQDKAGNFYFGTRTGLSVYNGETITNHYVKEGFPPRPIVCMVIDANDNVWCGTQGGGLVKFDGKKFKTYTDKDGLSSDIVRSLEIDTAGLLWIGTQDGVSTFDGDQFSVFKTRDHRDKTVYDIHQDSKGNMWFACAEGIIKFDGNRLKYFSANDGVSDSRVLSIGESSDGIIWFGTLEGGVTRFDGTSFEAITMADGLPSNRIWGIVTDADGSVWFCTQGGGIARYNGGALMGFTTQQGLAHNLVWSITQDQRGAMWFGHDIGFSSFDGDFFSSVTSKDSLLHFFAIEVDSKGHVWGGGRQGLIQWNGKNLIQYSLAQGLASNQITDIVIDKSDILWIGTEEGVTRFDGKAFTNFVLENKTGDRRVSRVFIDRDQKLWASTTNKIFRYNDSASRFEQIIWPGFPDNFTATAIAQDKQGYYWLGSRTGLVRYDGKSCKHFTYDDGMPNDHIFDMSFDPNTQDLWMGTNLGLIKLSFKDRENNVLAAGNLTVENEVLKTFEPLWSEFNRNTGYPLDDLNHPALFVSTQRSNPGDSSPESVLWAGFADKLFRFDPTAAETKPKTTKLAIHSLKLDGRLVPWSSLKEFPPDDSLILKQESLALGKSLTPEARQQLREEYRGVRVKEVEKFSGLPRGLILPHRIDQITFDFGAIKTSNTILIKYQYRLRGQQEDWSYPSTERSATFTNPWEGSYTFEVRAQSPNSTWTSPATFSFTVLPPWWRTWPMYGAYIVTLAFSLIVFVKMSKRKLRWEKQFLENIVNERTNELVVQMTSVEMQKQEAQKQKLEADRQRLLVEEKNEEIAKQLADTEASLSNLTLQMIQRFHAYSELEQELKKIAETSDAKKYQRAFSLITMNKSLDKEWEQFNFYFNGIYKDFNYKLREQSQQLSNYDLRMCALIKMGLENREIAMLLNIEASSVKMAKYRLKKKFNIDESVSLRDYFETL